MSSQQQPRLNSRPTLPRVSSGPTPAPSPKIHVIVRLPYNRPPDAPTSPPQVIWSPEKEKVLWDELSRPRTNLNAINWTGLSAQLDVPVPYLLYRAQVKYEEDLRGLQGIRQGPLSAGPPLSTPAHSPADDRPVGLSAQRAITGRAGSSNSNPLSPSPSTPTCAPARRLSSSGPIGSRWSRGSNASIHTIIQPAVVAPTTRMLKLNPVLTPLRTATGSKPSTPSSGRSTPSGTDSEAEREAKQEAQREEADQLAQKLKELQKKIGSGSFGFATARPKQVENSPAPSVSASQIRSQTATVSLPRAQRSSVTPTGAAMTADTSGTTSASASMSQRGSIPDIPSPLSDSRARLPVRVTRRATSVGTRRSPSTVSEVQDRGPVGRTRAQDAGSGQVSSASSFSDLSDTDMSASALEDALMSNNFKSTTAASRMSMFSRAHHSRGHANIRQGRYP